MATQLASKPPPDARLVRLTVEAMREMDRQGLLPDVKFELIDGHLVEMSPAHLRHARVMRNVFLRLREALLESGSGLDVDIEAGMRCSDYSETAPDVTVWEAARLTGTIPASRARLVVEVADSTRSRDLGLKRAIYARAAIPEYWVIDLMKEQTRQFWTPRGDEYAEDATAPLGQPLRARTLPDLALATDGLDW